MRGFQELLLISRHTNNLNSDSGSFDICERLIEKMGILPYMRRILRDAVEVFHPKERLGVLAGTETVEYTVGIVKMDKEEMLLAKEEGNLGVWTCKIRIGARDVVSVDGGVTKKSVLFLLLVGESSGAPLSRELEQKASWHRGPPDALLFRLSVLPYRTDKVDSEVMTKAAEAAVKILVAEKEGKGEKGVVIEFQEVVMGNSEDVDVEMTQMT